LVGSAAAALGRGLKERCCEALDRAGHAGSSDRWVRERRLLFSIFF